MDPMHTDPVGNTPIHYPRGGAGIQRYALQRRDSVVALMPSGESQTTVLGRTAYVTITWIASDSGTRLTAQVDSVRADSMQGLPSAALDSARGARWTALRLPNGRVQNFTGGSGSLVGDQVRDQLALLFPPLPITGAVANASWTDSTSGPARVSAFDAVERALITAHALSERSEAGALQIEVTRNRTASGQGRQFGQAITVSGSGVDSLTYELGADARVMHVEGRRLTEVTVVLPAIGQQVTARESSLLVMSLLR
jgi:hypothetical protein